jgi:CHAT domain-containing protein
MVKHRIGDRADVLDGASASRTAVLAALENRSGIHFACHGSMDLDHPAQSGLSLHDHVLTIADLAGLRESADFAYLSACRTATGSSHLPDETMTLAAALHYAGFAHVIGSLSGIADRAAADVAESVYGRMIDSHGFDPDRAPRALHEALQEHRRRSSPLRTWTAFTHTGP